MRQEVISVLRYADAQVKKEYSIEIAEPLRLAWLKVLTRSKQLPTPEKGYADFKRFASAFYDSKPHELENTINTFVYR